MTKARFQSAILLDAPETAFLLFAQSKGLGKSRAEVIRQLIKARRIQYQSGFNAWLVSPEGRSVLRAEGLDGLVAPEFGTQTITSEPEPVEYDLAAQHQREQEALTGPEDEVTNDDTLHGGAL